jgi:hypothetical protein
MEDLMWGELPKQRVRKEEKFLTPVLTMNAVEKIGAGRRFVFNKAAQTALGIVGEERISFGFDKANNAIAVRKSDTEKSLQLTKTCTVSNKEWFEFIAKHFGLNIEVENNFDLVPTNNYFTLSLRVLDNDSNNVVEEENPVIEFHTTDLGEISEEQDLRGDLSNIPNVETLGLDTVTESGVEGLAEAVKAIETVEEQVEEEIFNVQDAEEVIETEEEDDWA